MTPRPPSDLFQPHVMKIVEALKPAETRAVGGSVRAFLKDEPLEGVDIDLATTATPDEVQAALKKNLIAFTAPGLIWGTVIAQTPAGKVEITSLREDAYLPGSRYPSVKFVQNWETDALRRDFTFNAIYLSPMGDLFDPYAGQSDLITSTVRFIGNPVDRLREDPLRLLRFCRFCGTYGLSGATPSLTDIFQQATPAYKTLSRRRMDEEMEKLRQTPQGKQVEAYMRQNNLLPPHLSAQA